jgi:ribosome-binding protein aMBF1 (putative translation factor)
MSKKKTAVRVYSTGVPWRAYLDKQLENPEFRAEYDALEPEFALIQQLIDIRNKRGLSQRQLAERAGMKQPVIARLESGRAAGFKTLKRLAEALDARLEIKIVPHKASPERAASGSKRTRTKRA